MTVLRAANTRKKAYEALEKTGASQEALWEAIEYLLEKDNKAPDKVKAALDKRKSIKQKYVQ